MNMGKEMNEDSAQGSLVREKQGRGEQIFHPILLMNFYCIFSDHMV